jgi:hypothetical protein
MWHRIDVVLTDVSEESIASIFRVTPHLHGSTSQKTAFFIFNSYFIFCLVTIRRLMKTAETSYRVAVPLSVIKASEIHTSLFTTQPETECKFRKYKQTLVNENITETPRLVIYQN